MEKSSAAAGGAGGRGVLGLAGALSVKESIEILENASKSSARAKEVQEDARATVETMKEASSKFEKTVKDLDATCKHSTWDLGPQNIWHGSHTPCGHGFGCR